MVVHWKNNKKADPQKKIEANPKEFDKSADFTPLDYKSERS